MNKFYQILLALWAVLAGQSVAGQVLRQQQARTCGTPDLTKEYLAAHPEIKARYQWRPAPPMVSPTAPYPNPAASRLQLPGYQGTVVVYNQQGKPVQTLLAPGTAAGATLDTSAWPDGLYVVTGRNASGEFQRHNVQIQH